MNTNSFARTILAVFVGLFLFTGVDFGQTFKNGGTLINGSGKTIMATNFQNFGTAAGTLHNGGTLNVSGTFTNGNGTLNSTFNNFYGPLVGGTAVIANFVQNSSVDAYNDSSTTIGYLKLTATGSPITSTAGSLSTPKGRVEYGAAGNQTVAAVTGGYGTLISTGSGVKTIGSAVAINDSGRIQGSPLKVNGVALTVHGSGIATVTASDTIDASSPSSSVAYDADAAQSVAPGTYLSLTLSGGTAHRTKAVSSGDLNLVPTTGSLTLSDTNEVLDIAGASSNFRASSVATFANSGTIRIAGSAFFTSGITAGSFDYYGSAQTIGGAIYNNLTLSGGTGAKTYGGNTSVTGTYDVSGMTGTSSRSYASVTFTYAGTGASQNVVAGTSLAHEVYFDLAFSGVATKSIPTSSFLDATTVQLNAGGAVTNNATFAVGTGGLTNSITFNNAGPLTITGAGATGITNGGTLANTSTISLTTSDFNNNGTLSNDGTITVN